MNIFHSFTKKSLLCNKTRTAVTIIGIVLSMALLTAVIEAAYSGLQYLLRVEEERVGSFHGFYCDLTEEQAKADALPDDIRDTATLRLVGWADAGSQNEDKPYLLIQSAGADFYDMVSVHLTQGRLPEREDELLLPEHLQTLGQVFYNLGAKIELEVGRRTSGGETCGALSEYLYEEEQLTDTVSKRYTVVGYYERFDRCIEPGQCASFIALTANATDTPAGDVTSVFFTVKHPSSFYNNSELKSFAPLHAHSDLLMFSGSLRNGNLTSVLYGLVAILVLLISLGSITLIYNSFSISVSERTRQFGILKSIGATRAQIRHSVLYEALLVCLIGIPIGLLIGCVGIGITLWCLRDAFALIAGSNAHVQMSLVINPLGLLISALVCLLTTLISAFLPAQCAIRISPIDSIRQTQDIKLRPKDVRTRSSGVLIQRLFGFEGMLAKKNFSRDKKRYRATVISLFLSVTLFIAASSFCTYMTDSVTDITSFSGGNGADLQYVAVTQDPPEAEQLLALLSRADAIQKKACTQTSFFQVHYDSSMIEQTFKDIEGAADETNPEADKMAVYTYVMFLDDASFAALCTANGLDSANYLDAASPKGLFYNQLLMQYQDGARGDKFLNTSFLKKDALPSATPLTVPLTYEKSLPSFTCVYKESNEQGDMLYYYFPDAYLDTLESGETPDKREATVLSAEEAMARSEIHIADMITELPFWCNLRALPMVFYPMSVRDSVLPDGDTIRWIDGTTFQFASSDHRTTADSLRALLIDNNLPTSRLHNNAEAHEAMRMLILAVNVFAYGFIILISLIAVANVFNTISTSIALRRREFAMLRSVGMTNRAFLKMMRYECLMYGIKGLFWGLLAAFGLTYMIFRVTDLAYTRSFYMPWSSVCIAIASVFAVVFATMLYATRKLRKDNLITALRNENL